MEYCTFKLDKELHGLCIIVTPFGQYKLSRLQTGIKQSPDLIVQEIMEDAFRDIKECKV